MKLKEYNEFKELPLSILGPSFEEKKCPTLLYFSLSAHESLCLEPYNQPAADLAADDFRVISLTLPGHFEGQDKHTAMSYWAQHLPELEVFMKNLHALVDHLVERGYINPKAFAVAGLSRGGYLALHLLTHPKVMYALGIAPVTDLGFLSEFSDQTLPEFFSLNKYYKQIHNKTIRLYIGNRDQKVSTKRAFDFVHSLSDYAYENRIRSPKIEMVISPSTGYMGHGTLPHTFRDAALWIKKQIVH